MKPKRKIGLFFGSFNPIHIGHLIIANYIKEHSDLFQIWFVVSPRNPLKEKPTLLDERQRLYMVKLAIDDNANFRGSDIEFDMPQPSYTTVTLAYLSDNYPNYEFCLIMGADNLQNIRKWKNYQVILDNYKIYVYPRSNIQLTETDLYGNVEIVDAPQIEISASKIRKMIQNDKSIKYIVPEAVIKVIDEMMFYK
ncbi:MAG: nicotinate (nicotinamide) nucleotide adenylyltransferase [Bacteroidales bacterium]|jgi:nicotinate-nucleotide adenylyltransferase|nr:nicotinate-nucleotide adenylyltransferase [Bacteroidales bacterium]